LAKQLLGKAWQNSFWEKLGKTAFEKSLAKQLLRKAWQNLIEGKAQT
jgi:hypothetical protein